MKNNILPWFFHEKKRFTLVFPWKKSFYPGFSMKKSFYPGFSMYFVFFPRGFSVFFPVSPLRSGDRLQRLQELTSLQEELRDQQEAVGAAAWGPGAGGRFFFFLFSFCFLGFLIFGF